MSGPAGFFERNSYSTPEARRSGTACCGLVSTAGGGGGPGWRGAGGPGGGGGVPRGGGRRPGGEVRGVGRRGVEGNHQPGAPEPQRPGHEGRWHVPRQARRGRRAVEILVRGGDAR